LVASAEREVLVALLIAKREIVEMLRRAGLPEAADEADRSLADRVELERAQEFGARYGITRDEADQPHGRQSLR
jgi:hypothetical protein